MNLRETIEIQATGDRFWIGVDFDGTLAYYDGNVKKLGKPIPKMLKRVKAWLAEGQRVKIFTARASDPEQKKRVEQWCKKHGLEDVEVTNEKDHLMVELWDDKAISVVPNTGEVE